jgi:hypothetical protein
MFLSFLVVLIGVLQILWREVIFQNMIVIPTLVGGFGIYGIIFTHELLLIYQFYIDHDQVEPEANVP